MAYMEYTTLSDFKAYFPNTTLSDGQISAFIMRASKLLDAELWDNIGEQTITKRMDGYGKAKLIMENRITSVWYVKYKSRDAWFDVDLDFIDGAILHLEAEIPSWDKNVEIQYTKWYTELPTDIQDFFHLYCARLMQLDGYVSGSQPGEVKSKRINWLGITYKTPSEIADAETSKGGIFGITFVNILDKYKIFSLKIA